MFTNPNNNRFVNWKCENVTRVLFCDYRITWPVFYSFMLFRDLDFVYINCTVIVRRGKCQQPFRWICDARISVKTFRDPRYLLLASFHCLSYVVLITLSLFMIWGVHRTPMLYLPYMNKWCTQRLEEQRRRRKLTVDTKENQCKYKNLVY